MNNNIKALYIREQIKKLEANIHWLEQTDRFDRVDELEDKLHELREELESFEV